ncbi:MAG: hypothetical protein AAEJ65_08805 [Planctomycetota bacterium]
MTIIGWLQGEFLAGEVGENGIKKRVTGVDTDTSRDSIQILDSGWVGSGTGILDGICLDSVAGNATDKDNFIGYC